MFAPLTTYVSWLLSGRRPQSLLPLLRLTLLLFIFPSLPSSCSTPFPLSLSFHPDSLHFLLQSLVSSLLPSFSPSILASSLPSITHFFHLCLLPIFPLSLSFPSSFQPFILPSFSPSIFLPWLFPSFRPPLLSFLASFSYFLASFIPFIFGSVPSSTFLPLSPRFSASCHLTFLPCVLPYSLLTFFPPLPFLLT